MTNSLPIRVAAVCGLLSVAFGAFGAHALKDVLARNQMSPVWEKAVFYQFIHTLMLFVLALRRPLPLGPWISFLCGILLFSGSLYAYALTRVSWLAAFTPIGGTSFLVGWLWLALAPGGLVRE